MRFLGRLVLRFLTSKDLEAHFSPMQHYLCMPATLLSCSGKVLNHFSAVHYNNMAINFCSYLQSKGLHFRHTDNTVQWLRAMESVGLPKVRGLRCQQHV